MSERNASLLAEDILDSIRKINVYTEGMSKEEFLKDDKTIDAVIRNFEIIGEAANRMPEDLRDRFDQIDWHRIRGFRNRIVHDYMGVDLNIVWKILEDDLEKLFADVQHMKEAL
jgi:uncharacterized protein with HEPN domain